MIVSVPTATDFQNHGVDFLNLAWIELVDLHMSFKDIEGMEDRYDLPANLWDTAEREMGTALSLAEQGAEFLLKSKICEISPWLLISRNAPEWPKKSDSTDVPFGQFRTIDAQDLIKVHDTFATTRLKAEFRTTFENLRKQRNSIMHTVDKNLRLSAGGILESILLVAESLLGEKKWIETRRSYLRRDRWSQLSKESTSDYTDYQIVTEVDCALTMLNKAQLKRFFGFNTRLRTYICPYCSRLEFTDDLECRTATLSPNTPGSTSIHCFVCEKFQAVRRTDCPLRDCPGNVMQLDEERCLTCDDC